ISEVRSILGLGTLLRQLQPARVMSFSIKPNLYAALLNVFRRRYRQFCMVTGLGYVFIGEGYFKKLFRTAIDMTYRVLFSSVDKVIFQNSGDRELFVSRRLVTSGKAVVIPGTGIDLDYFSAKSDYKKSPVIRFLFVGRLLQDKGLGELLQAASALSSHNIEVAILGPYDDNPGGSDRKQIQDAVNLGTIAYLGVTEDVRPQLLASDVFVLPSYREGLSRSILEAMATGLPVITTDVPGCRDLVKNGVNGLLVPPRNSQALAEAMRRFVEQPALIEQFGRASRRIAEESFDVEHVNKMLFQYMGLEQLLDGSCVRQE
ncbi:MAG: glycosyltransferase family 4 protein, partial [Gammaproteobacteria bacterium]|nr:glycosyltransferase family 4 protein [Gammaproteobacteria bacterium]